MRDDDEDLAKQDYSEEEYDNGFLRWMSVAVVVVAVAGFFALAWYAYHTGSQSESVENVTLVEADKAPLKEAPADPGGLQFPHQDKTVYDAISNNSAASKPVAERVLPAPEEPVKLEEKAKNDTGTWVNEKLYPDSKSATNSKETLKIFKAEDEAAPKTSAPKIIRIDPVTGETRTETTTAIPAPAPETPAAANEGEVTSFSQPPTEIKEVPVKTEMEKPVAKPAAAPMKKDTAKPVAGGTTRVQLGAFRSQKEADGTWSKIRSAQAALVADKQHQVVQADLGEKGIFYRLQLTGFSGPDQAKNFCAEMASKKQGCFLVKSN